MLGYPTALRMQGHTRRKCCMQFWASPAVEKTLEVSERAHSRPHASEKSVGSVARGANYTLSTAAGNWLPRFSFEVAIVAHVTGK